MIQFQSDSLVTRANREKEFARQKVENSNSYQEAAEFFFEASLALTLELEESNYSLYKMFYGRILEEYLNYQHYDCEYFYYKSVQQYKKAEISLNGATRCINNIGKYSIEPDPTIKASQDYDERQYKAFITRIGADSLSIIVKKTEFIAKRYFENKKYDVAVKKYHETLYHIKNWIEYLSKNISYLEASYLSNAKLNHVIISFNYSQSLIGLWRTFKFHKSKRPYYILAITKNLIDSLEYAEGIIKLKQDDEAYKTGLEMQQRNIKKFIAENKDSWNVILDEYRDNKMVIETLKETDLTLYTNLKANLRARRPERYILVFMLHGFNTRGEWKNNLTTLLAADDNGTRFIPVPWDYGLFRFLRFISPFARRRVIREFHDFYNETVFRYGNLLSELTCVAHSFGTFIISQNILRFPEVFFDKIVFVGGILRRDFNWWYPYSIHRNLRVRSEIHRKDKALTFAYLYSKLPWIRWIGDSGKKGFINNYAFINTPTYNYSDHSDMFGITHMNNQWLPFLRS
jgi:hypothetical protein